MGKLLTNYHPHPDRNYYVRLGCNAQIFLDLTPTDQNRILRVGKGKSLDELG